MTSDVRSTVDNNERHHHERSPLIVSLSTEEDSGVPPNVSQQHGIASVQNTILNQMKTACGTGILALPYACREGGILLYVGGLIGIALWNVYASTRLVECLELLQPATTINGKSHNLCNKPLAPPRGTATLGKVAWYALGPSGLVVLDFMTVVLLMGILVAYNDAIRSFLQGTPFTTSNDVLDAILIAFLIAPLSVVPDMGYLTKTSAAGLSVLALALFVITGYGLSDYNRETTPFALDWFPRDGLSGVSRWFGCTVFGFGIVPLTFNFRESMAEPARYPYATLVAMLLVAVAYIIVGIALLILYPTIEADVLSEIPQGGTLPTVTRLAMVVVVIATAPLLIVPCGELIEGKIHRGEEQGDARTKLFVRFGICFVTIAISVGVPGFVGVLTFVGCFCVALVSFCIPPFLHLVLLLKRTAPANLLWVDMLVLAWGLTATGISTAYVFRQVAPQEATT